MATASAPRRVLMIADVLGGVWQYALDLSRSLARSHVAVTLATLGGELSETQRRQAQRVSGLIVRSAPFKLEWMDDPWDDVDASGRWLLALQETVEPDVVHLNGFCHGSLGWSAPVLMVAHSCVLSWWDSVKAGPLPRKWDRYRSEVRRGLHAADRVVAPSRWMAASVERWYAVPSIDVVPNGRDAADGFFPGTKQPMVLAAGLWDDAKNLEVLDRACAGLEWPLYLAGDLRGPFGQLFVPRNGVVLGALSPLELAAWMRQASIYAFPAKYEPFGLSVLEAALCGCTLVLGDIPSLRENWNDVAVFVPPDDDRAIRRTLDALVASPGIRSELGRRALERAAQLTTERMTLRYLSVYQQLISSAGDARVRTNARV